MIKRIKQLIIILLIPSAFASTWQPNTLKKINIKNKSQYTYILFNNKKLNYHFYINAVLLKKSNYRARLINHHLKFTGFFKSRVYNTTKAAHAFLGVNGSYFTASFNPLGLVVINGHVVSPFNRRSRLLSGLVLIDEAGNLSIKTKWSHYHHARFALQAGPFLIRPNGRITMKHRGPRERRTVLALTQKNNLLVLSTTAVSLYDLAYAIKHNPSVFGAKRITTALNLDGGTSTAMTLLIPNHQPIIIPEFFPVKNALVFYLRHKHD